MKQLTISEVLSMLEQGKTRDEINEYFGLERKIDKDTLWKHPKLKGKKTRVNLPTISIIDDTEENIEIKNNVMEVVGQVEDVVTKVEFEEEIVDEREDVKEFEEEVSAGDGFVTYK